MGKRVTVFIDGSNLYHNLKSNNLPTRLDFYKFGLALAGNRDLVRIYYYNAILKQQDNPAQYSQQQTFFNRLRRTSYVEVKLGYFLNKTKRCEKCRDVNSYQIEKGVDEDCLGHDTYGLSRSI